MQKIIPHLWFDTQAKEAAEFYCKVFANSKITHSVVLQDTPGGDSEPVTFNLNGHDFMAISAGPQFAINPSISFMVNFDPSQNDQAREHLDELWAKLIDGGEALMPLDQYPFSQRYGWVKDRFGTTWQLILTNPEGEPRPFIIPSLMFVGDGNGRAEEAISFYVDVFKDSAQGTMARYPAGMEPDKEGAVMFADFTLEGQWFAAMDSARQHGHTFDFNEAVSLLVNCSTQQEIDYYWERLSAVPEAEQCGWLKDKFGVSWQVSPVGLGTMMHEGTPEQVARVTQAFLKMKKLDIAELEAAYNGN